MSRDFRFVTIGSQPTVNPTELFWADSNPSGATDYYVDGNKSASGDGLSWATAKTTLAAAVTLSDTSIALTANRWWARRNRIFVAGDTLTENLVKFPTKCDVIGVGSYDANTQPGITGRHLPVGEAYGTRFYNIHFKAIAHASPIITLTSASSGIQFQDCTFDGTIGTMTSGILATASPFLVVNNCDFVGTFVTSYITLGAGEAGRTRITNNRMLGTAAIGIVVNIGTTTSWISLIDNNIIRSTGIWVDENCDLFVISNNKAITDVDCATYTAGFDMNLLLASNNVQTGANAGDHDTVPHQLFA